MAFQQSNGFSNNSNYQGGGEKKKTNFRIGKIYGVDGIMEVSVWVSDTGAKTILSIKSAIGKDPSTGNNVYESKMPSELPRFFMNLDIAKAFIDASAMSEPDKLHFSIEIKGSGNKLTVESINPRTIKLTIECPKVSSTPRSITFEAIPVGFADIHASYNNLVEMVKIGYKKTLQGKLDPEEFSMVLGNNDDGDTGESPF